MQMLCLPKFENWVYTSSNIIYRRLFHLCWRCVTWTWCWCLSLHSEGTRCLINLHIHPIFSKIAFVSLAAMPLTPNALTCVPLRSRCSPTATFQPSSSCKTNTYLFPSWSRILALRTCSPLNSPLCGTMLMSDFIRMDDKEAAEYSDIRGLQAREHASMNESDSSEVGVLDIHFLPNNPKEILRALRDSGLEPEFATKA